MTENSARSFSARATKALASSTVGLPRAGAVSAAAAAGAALGPADVSAEAVATGARQIARLRTETLAFMGSILTFLVRDGALLNPGPRPVKRRGNRRSRGRDRAS